MDRHTASTILNNVNQDALRAAMQADCRSVFSVAEATEKTENLVRVFNEINAKKLAALFTALQREAVAAAFGKLLDGEDESVVDKLIVFLKQISGEPYEWDSPASSGSDDPPYYRPADDFGTFAVLLRPPAEGRPQRAGIDAGGWINLLGALGRCSGEYSGYLDQACTANGGQWSADNLESAVHLGEVLAGLNQTICYNEPCIRPTKTKAEGLYRMLVHGVQYDPDGNTGAAPAVEFPGWNTDQLALMMNQLGAAEDLITLINTTDLKDVVVLVGCGGKVEGFQEPCAEIGEGWSN